jgi:hypothetical protein
MKSVIEQISYVKFNIARWYNTQIDITQMIIMNSYVLLLTAIGSLESYIFWKCIGIPSDGHFIIYSYSYHNGTRVPYDISKREAIVNSWMSLMIYGTLISYMTDAYRILQFTSPYMLVPYFITIPVFSALNKPYQSFTLTKNTFIDPSPKDLVLTVFCAGVLLVLFGCHIYEAYKIRNEDVQMSIDQNNLDMGLNDENIRRTSKNKRLFATLYITRLIFIASFIAVTYISYFSNPSKFHLHHWSLSMLISINCIFNKKISFLTLGIFFGIMVQGITLYGAQSLII